MATEITPGKAYGFFTDTSVCIGCKACEVACKEWNQLPEGELGFLGESLDNTGALDGTTWRHVQFIDNVEDETMGQGDGKAFLLMSDVCKHCKEASCLEVCPTGAIIRTEFDSVFIQEDVCNGCRACIAACPYDVIEIDHSSNVARKCTLCYDRLQGGMQPACAKACPTESIQFGELTVLKRNARKREADLHAQGLKEARLYGADDDVYGGLNAFFLLMDEPETYGFPNAENAVLPERNNAGGYLGALATAVLGAFGALFALRERGKRKQAEEEGEAQA
jgi:formate dehydrogenase iron-sulfur subunit